MLLIGSEAPDTQYLSKNNGASNAYTSSSNTNYHFRVSPTALSGAIERFAGFFHSPLFAPSCTTRELNAVDSEHKKNHQADLWRVFQLNKTLTKPGHPWSKFGTGNRETLSAAGREMKAKAKPLVDSNERAHLDVTSTAAFSPGSSRDPSPTPSFRSASSEAEPDGGTVGRETRRRLVEWWSKEYCASRMNVCVIGRGASKSVAAPLFNVNLSQQNHLMSYPKWFADTFRPFKSVTKTDFRSLMTIHLGPMRWV